VARAAEPVVWVALSEAGGAHAEAAAAAANEIEGAGSGRGDAVVRHWREFRVGELPAPRLIIAVGNQARRGIMESEHKAPLLAVLVTRSAHDHALADAGGRAHSAVVLDQPPARQLAALRLALPALRRVGILFGPESRLQEAAFLRAATESGLQLVTGRVDSPELLGGVLQRTLEDSELLLAVADPGVFNNASIQNILTAAYRRRVPLAAFSPAYVRAGALLALYSTPAQVGRQAGEMARAFLAGRPLPPLQAPQDFVISINAEVARSLGIPLQAANEHPLALQLRAAERKP
jgi:ABC-type uncharacterized transport system substrate-binding protein